MSEWMGGWVGGRVDPNNSFIHPSITYLVPDHVAGERDACDGDLRRQDQVKHAVHHVFHR
jgi:hypothetical protein